MHLKTKQLTHTEIINTTYKVPVILVCDRLQSPANAGGLLRLCEAMGVEKIYFSASQFDLSSNRLKRTARNAEKNISYEFVEDIHQLIKKYKSKNYFIAGLEVTNTSSPISQIKNLNAKKVLLILGNEKQGISEQVLQEIEHCYHIPMSGINSSMNVVHASAIALYLLKEHLNDTREI